MEEKVRRKVINYSIKREMQIRLLVKLMIIVLVSVGLTGVFFYLYSNQEVGQTFTQFHIRARSFLDYLLPAVVIAILLGILVAFVMALFFPQRIAGPLYRIERDLREKVGEGDLTVRFMVRKGDEMEELADSLNVMMEKMAARVERINSLTKELVTILEGNGMDREEVIKVARRLEEVVKEFKI